MSFNIYTTDFFEKELKRLSKSIFDKSDKENISDHELDMLLKFAGLF